MAMPASDIAEAHRAFGESDDVLFRRRALYSLTIETATTRAATTRITDPDVLDSPLTRGHLGDFLCGRERFSAEAMIPLSELGEVPDGAAPLTPRVATRPSVRSALDPALRVASAGAGTGIGPVVLPGSPAHAPAVELIVDGVSLLRRLSPDIAEDVLPHIALIAVVPANPRLGSASFRELPGLVVIPEPRSVFEVTEALVHEGAHQRYFDLGVTCSLLDASAFEAPSFRASWSPEHAPAWPIEQCLAAFHAYRCLAALELARAAADVERHDFSLLPNAHERAEEIAAWLGRRDDHLGNDGRRFLDLLTGTTPRPIADAPAVGGLDEAIAFRDCGDRVLLAFAENPVRLVWRPAGMAG